MLVSRAQFAEVLGLSANRVSELKIEGVIDSGDRKTYDAEKCADKFVGYRKAKSSQIHRSSDREEVGSRLRKARSFLLRDQNKRDKLFEETVPLQSSGWSIPSFEPISQESCPHSWTIFREP